MTRFPLISCHARQAFGLRRLATWLISAALLAACLNSQAAQTPVTPRVTDDAVQTEVLASGLEHPWAVAFLPDAQAALITERPGRLRYWSAAQGLGPALKGLPTLFAQGQGGLLDVALHPDFAANRLVYLSFSQGDARQPTEGPAGTAVGVGKLSADHRSLEDFRIIFEQMPKLSSGNHFGSRLVFDGEGHLYIALGENNQRMSAQALDKLQGKVVRLREDGSIPADNPYVQTPGARPEVWSYGHRNPQGAALNPWTGQLWTNEHGPRGGDEINIEKPGANYGWPLATHGINYSGLPIPEAKGEAVEGTEPPHHVWEVSPAISGMAFYDHERFPQWRRSVFIGALKEKALIRLPLAEDGQTIQAEHRLLESLDARIRDVRVGPDGNVYVLTDARDGKLIRVTPSP